MLELWKTAEEWVDIFGFELSIDGNPELGQSLAEPITESSEFGQVFGLSLIFWINLIIFDNLQLW